MSDSLAAFYTDEIREKLEHLGVWRPNSPLRLGDLGLMDGNRFIRQSSLNKELGLEVGDVREAAEKDTSYRSNGAVSIDVDAGAKGADPSSGIVHAGAEIQVSFLRENAILLDMVGCVSLQVEDQLTLGRELVRAWREGRWDPKWCVIVELVRAESTTALMSTGAKGSIGLKTSAAAEIGEAISLADARLGLSRIRSSGVGLEQVGAADATPLVRGLRLKKHWWNKDPKTEIEGIEEVGSEEPFEDEEPIDYFDLLGRD